MIKNKLFLSISLLTVSISTYALDKNIDFYNGTNRYSLNGTVNEFKNVKYEENIISLQDGNESTYLTVNKQTPSHLYYSNQEVNFESIINQNKGKELIYKDRPYTVIGYSGQSLVLSDKSSGDPKSNYLFLNNLNSFELPKEWVTDYEKGLKASFNENIKDTDKLFYSQLDTNLTYTNNYQIKIIDNNKLNFTHYIDITNTSNQRYDKVNLSFFIGEMNINNHQPIIMYKTKNSRSDMMSMSNNVEQFELQDFSNTQVISIKEPVTLLPNFNRIKYDENKLDYKLITKIEGIQKLYSNISENEILEEINKSKPFKNYLLINPKDNNQFIPNGKINVYEELKDKDKLIIETNIATTKNKPIELLKNVNSDVLVIHVKLNEIKKEVNKNTYIEKEITAITIKNRGKEDYIIARIKDNMDYELINIKADTELTIAL